MRILGNENGILRLMIEGNLSRDRLPYARDTLVAACGPDVYKGVALISMIQSLYVDSSGIEYLLTWHKHFEAAGGLMVCHSASPAASQILRLMRLDRCLHLAPTERAALEKVDSILRERLANQPVAEVPSPSSNPSSETSDSSEL